MFTTVQGYDDAQLKLGVRMVKYKTLTRKYKQFSARNRDGFEAFMHRLGRSATQHWHRNIHMGYINVESQSMWCAWIEALLCVPSLSKLGRDAEREALLFRNFMFTYEHEHAETAPEVGSDPQTLCRHQAWQAALDFGLTTLQDPVWAIQSPEPPAMVSSTRRSKRR